MGTTSAFDKVGLEGKVITITGGAGGIGQATALLCAARGASVVIADLDETQGANVVAKIRDAGGQAAFKRTDVSHEDDVQALIEFAVTTYGGLHAAFNNAGMDTGGSAFAEFPLEQWQRGVEVNLTGVFLCVKHQLRHMLEHGGGAILNTSSVSGVIGTPGAADYVAAKHGVIGVTRAAASEVSGKGIRVNAIVPGATETPIFFAAVSTRPGLREVIEAAHPIGRVAQPDEMAEAATWLLSDAASFVTGACITVDGGYTAL